MNNNALLANTILAQISMGDEKALDKWAADLFIAWPDGVMFDVLDYQAKRVHIEIELTPEDLYKVTFKKKKPYGKLILLKTINGIFFDMLNESIDRYLGYR